MFPCVYCKNCNSNTLCAVSDKISKCSPTMGTNNQRGSDQLSWCVFLPFQINYRIYFFYGVEKIWTTQLLCPLTINEPHNSKIEQLFTSKLPENASCSMRTHYPRKRLYRRNDDRQTDDYLTTFTIEGAKRDAV